MRCTSPLAVPGRGRQVTMPHARITLAAQQLLACRTGVVDHLGQARDAVLERG
jgi:hypothetical protein